MRINANLKKWLALGALVMSAVGCTANGVDADALGDGFGNGNNNGGGSNGSPTDITNCQVPVGATLCVLGGSDHPGGLVDVLLASDGPLGPIAGAIDVTALTNALTQTLENDSTLAGIVTGLIQDGQLVEGLQLLLLGPNNDGMGAVAETLQLLLLPNEQGVGLTALLGEQGVAGLVQALLLDGTDASCQAPLGTLCLIAGDGNQTGLVDLLLTSDGALGALSPFLTTQVTDEVVATLGDLLASNGSLRDLVTGLIQDGQLATALQVLLIGAPDQGVQSGLVMALQDLLGGLGIIVNDVLTFVGSLLGTAP